MPWSCPGPEGGHRSCRWDGSWDSGELGAAEATGEARGSLDAGVIYTWRSLAEKHSFSIDYSKNAFLNNKGKSLSGWGSDSQVQGKAMTPGEVEVQSWTVYTSRRATNITQVSDT